MNDNIRAVRPKELRINEERGLVEWVFEDGRTSRITIVFIREYRAISENKLFELTELAARTRRFPWHRRSNW